MSSDLEILVAEGIPDDFKLNSLYEIENVVLLLKDMIDKVDYYKNLKKHRMSTIDEKIKVYEDRAKDLRDLIQRSLIDFEEKSLDFPGIARVGSRSGKGTWLVSNEGDLKDFLRQNGHENMISTVENIDKRQLSKLLDQMKKVGENAPGVEYKPGTDTLSVAFAKEDEPEEKSVKQSDKKSAPKKSTPKKSTAKKKVDSQPDERVDLSTLEV